MGPNCAQPGDHSGFTRLSSYASFIADATTCCTSTSSASCCACNRKISIQEFCVQCLTNTTKDSCCESCDIGALFTLSPTVRSLTFGNADYGPDMAASQIVAPLRYSINRLGCTDVSFAESSSPPIVLIDRGVCSFPNKTQLAQAAGAAAVIIINNLDSGAIPLTSGNDYKNNNDFGIPTISVSKQDGALLKQLVLQGEVTMALGRFQGGQLPTYQSTGRTEGFTPCGDGQMPLRFVSTVPSVSFDTELCF
jgi:hypothetical protein